MRAARGGMPYSVPRKRRPQPAGEEDGEGKESAELADGADDTAPVGTNPVDSQMADDALAEAALAESARQRALLAQRLAAVPESPARSDGVPGSPASVSVATPRRELPASQTTIQTSSGAVHFDSPARGSEPVSTPRRDPDGSEAAASQFNGRLTFAAAALPTSAGGPGSSRPAPYSHGPPGTPVQLSYGIAMQDNSELEELRVEFAETVARYRAGRLSKDQALATEAGVYRGAKAVSAGLADAVARPSQVLAAFGAELGRAA